MGYKWKPNKSQKAAFKAKMQDPAEQAAYNDKKCVAAEARRATSQYDYETAGGRYVPTKQQYNAACQLITGKHDLAERLALNEVINGFISNSRIHHDYIHVINGLIRGY